MKKTNKDVKDEDLKKVNGGAGIGGGRKKEDSNKERDSWNYKWIDSPEEKAQK